MKHRKIDLTTKVGSLKLRNPILLASGIIGAGREYAELIDYSSIGGIITKTVTREPKTGNLPPRIVETGDSVLNSIGLQNVGVDRFIEDNQDFLAAVDTKVIVSIGGSSIDELRYCAKAVSDLSWASAIELNLSCPNVKSGGMSFSMSPGGTSGAVAAVRDIIDKPLWVKLTPQVANIAEIAESAMLSGADAISAINTVPAFDIDLLSLKPKLGNGMGGLSGPAIFPLAMRAVYLMSQAIDIPIVAIGGVNTTERGLKLIAVGASAFQIGSSLFAHPELPEQMVDEIETVLSQMGIKSIAELVGAYSK